MPRKVNFGMINLTTPAAFDYVKQRVLYHYFETNSHDDKVEANRKLRIELDGVLYKFYLSHEVGIRKSKSNPNQNRYEILSNGQLIGKGGFAEFKPVLATLVPCIGERLVYKQKNRGGKIQRHNVHNPVENLYNEMELTQEISYLHAKTPTVKLNFFEEGSSLTVMKNLPGEDLSEVLKNDNLTVDERIHISIQLIRQLLEHFHDQDIIHRDLKPHNIKYDRVTKQLHIFDLGTAKRDTSKKVKETVGTPKYMSPEQWNNEQTGKSTDIYSLGKILSEIWKMPHMAAFADKNMNKDMYKAQLALLSLEGDVQFNMEKFDKIEDKNLNKELIPHLIHNMTKKEKYDRSDLITPLLAFEKMRLDRELQTEKINTNDYETIEYAHNLGLHSWKTFREFNKLKDLKPREYQNVILKDLQQFPNNINAIHAYLNTLGINAFNGLNTKAEIRDKIHSIQMEFQQKFPLLMRKEKALNTILQTLGNNTTSEFYLLIKDIHNDTLKINKKMDELPCNIDNLVIVNNKVSKILNKVNDKLRTVDIVYHRSNINNKYKLSHVVNQLLLSSSRNNASDDVIQLRNNIKATVIQYLNKNYTKETTKNSDRAASQERLQDMYELLYLVNKNKPAQTLVEELKSHLKFVERGFTSYFFQTGSELVDRVNTVLENYEKNHKVEPSSRNWNVL